LAFRREPCATRSLGGIKHAPTIRAALGGSTDIALHFARLDAVTVV
jgi:hypothetical protein